MQSAQWNYYNTQELPVATVDWSAAGEDFSTGWTFTLRMARTTSRGVTLMVKTTGITATAGGIVSIAWSTSDWNGGTNGDGGGLEAAVNGTSYYVTLFARRTADSKDIEFNPARPITLNLYATPGTVVAPGLVDPIYSAGSVSFTPTGSVSSRTVQAAIAEVATDAAADLAAGTEYVVRLGATNGSDDAAALQAALDIAQTTPVHVVGSPGVTYKARNLRMYGNTWLDRVNITYGGSNGTTAPLETIPVVLYGEGSSGTPLYNIRITGCTITGQRSGSDWSTAYTVGASAQDAIQLNYCYNAVVENCTITDHVQDGVVLSNSTGSTVRNCRITNCVDAAIETRAGSSYFIVNNIVTMCGDGIAAKPDVEDVLIQGNTIEQFRDGAVIYPARRWRIIGNRFYAATAPDATSSVTKQAVYATRHPSITASTNTITDIIVADNTISGYTGGSGKGIWFSTANGQTLARNVVKGNTILTCATGITSEGELVITENTITDANIGIVLSNSANVVENNRVSVTGTSAQTITCTGSNNSICGNYCSHTNATNVGSVDVSGSTNVITGNKVLGQTSATGQHIVISGDDNTISGNHCSGVQNQGIRLTGAADRNAVVGNRVMGAVFNGIQIQAGATDNLIAANVLKNNTTPLNDAGTTTTSASNVV